MNIPKEVIKAIKENEGFLGHIHLSPDADSIGSTLALKLGLEQLDKDLTLYSEDRLPDSSEFLPSIDSVSHEKLPEMVKKQIFNVYISLDTPKWGLITHHLPGPDFQKPVINIDHHPGNKIKGTYQWIDTKASSAAEMVFYLLKELKIDITPEIATCLLYGLVGDTGAFQNFNTSSQSLRMAAILIEAGGDYDRCLVELSRNLKYRQLRAWGTMLNNLKASADNSFVYTTLSFEESQDIDDLGMSRFANTLISRVKDTNFGAVLVEKEEGFTYGSIRSRKPEFDVSKIAEKLNGGGHKNAAGFRLEKPLIKAEQEFLNAVKSTS